jgi:F-box domain
MDRSRSAAASEQHSPLMSLPDDVLREVCTWLGTRSLVNASGTCRKLREIATPLIPDLSRATRLEVVGRSTAPVNDRVGSGGPRCDFPGREDSLAFTIYNTETLGIPFLFSNGRVEPFFPSEGTRLPEGWLEPDDRGFRRPFPGIKAWKPDEKDDTHFSRPFIGTDRNPQVIVTLGYPGTQRQLLRATHDLHFHSVTFREIDDIPADLQNWTIDISGDFMMIGHYLYDLKFDVWQPIPEANPDDMEVLSISQDPLRIIWSDKNRTTITMSDGRRSVSHSLHPLAGGGGGVDPKSFTVKSGDGYFLLYGNHSYVIYWWDLDRTPQRRTVQSGHVWPYGIEPVDDQHVAVAYEDVRRGRRGPRQVYRLALVRHQPTTGEEQPPGEEIWRCAIKEHYDKRSLSTVQGPRRMLALSSRLKGSERTGHPGTGSVYLFDAETGKRLLRCTTPLPSYSGHFGWNTPEWTAQVRPVGPTGLTVFGTIKRDNRPVERVTMVIGAADRSERDAADGSGV